MNFSEFFFKFSRVRFSRRGFAPPAEFHLLRFFRLDLWIKFGRMIEKVRKGLTLSTSKEFASDFGLPRFARRLICIGFWGQKRIGGSVGGKKIF